MNKVLVWSENYHDLQGIFYGYQVASSNEERVNDY